MNLYRSGLYTEKRRKGTDKVVQSKDCTFKKAYITYDRSITDIRTCLEFSPSSLVYIQAQRRGTLLAGTFLLLEDSFVMELFIWMVLPLRLSVCCSFTEYKVNST